MQTLLATKSPSPAINITQIYTGKRYFESIQVPEFNWLPDEVGVFSGPWNTLAVWLLLVQTNKIIRFFYNLVWSSFYWYKICVLDIFTGYTE